MTTCYFYEGGDLKYVSNKVISELVANWHSTGEMPLQLVEVVTTMSTGLRNRYTRQIEVEDAVQIGLLAIVRLKEKFDPSRELFNYFTTIILNDLRKQRMKNKRWDGSCDWTEGIRNGDDERTAREQAAWKFKASWLTDRAYEKLDYEK